MAAHGPVPRVLLADKGYDSDHIRASLQAAGAVPMIPARRNRRNPVQIDGFIYALRNRVERCFNKLRCSRRLATRYDKTAHSYLGFIHLASIRLWIRHFVNSS
jgi:transposase